MATLHVIIQSDATQRLLERQRRKEAGQKAVNLADDELTKHYRSEKLRTIYLGEWQRNLS